MVLARGAAAAGVGAVDDVVVDQRGGVHHLDHRAQADGARAGVAKLMRGQQQQRGANALAAALAQVLGDFGDGADAGGGVAAQLLLDRHEVFPQQLEDFSRRRYRQCAQVYRFSRFPFRCGLAGQLRVLMRPIACQEVS